MLDHDQFVVAALVEEGRISAEAAAQAGAEGAARKQSALEVLLAKGTITARQAAIARAVIAEVAFVDISAYEIEICNANLLPRAVAENLRAFPLFEVGDTVTVGSAEPLDLQAIDQVRAHVRAEVEFVICEPEAISRLIERAYAMGGGGRSGREVEPAVESAASLTTGREPIVAAVNQILAHAIERGASDIHLGPDEHALHLRFRVDGQLQAQQGPNLAVHAGLVQRLKVMASLDLTQNRRPQDGKFRFTHEGKSADIRISILPTVCGENVVMRLLSSAGQIKGFNELGLLSADRARLEHMLDAPNGMMLVTGPTGSGKTTTLYTCLKQLNTPDVNIMTIEDPVEIRMPMIRQVQAHAEIGMTFAGALRSILRQDPDIVLVGEIRDEETAKIAVQAALTGHLVLSSLHTNDAPGAIPRLVDLGVPGFAINASLLGVVAQRLVRRICSDCSTTDTPDPLVLARFGADATGPGAAFSRGGGCPRCAGTGFKGRLGIYEILTMRPGVQAAIDHGASHSKIAQAAMNEGMTPMWKDGLAKAKLALTTLEEVTRQAAIGQIGAQEADTKAGEARLGGERRAA